jgi:hypothetical protein
MEGTQYARLFANIGYCAGACLLFTLIGVVFTDRSGGPPESFALNALLIEEITYLVVSFSLALRPPNIRLWGLRRKAFFFMSYLFPAFITFLCPASITFFTTLIA